MQNSYELCCTKVFSDKFISWESQCRVLGTRNFIPCGFTRTDFIAPRWEGVSLIGLVKGK